MNNSIYIASPLGFSEVGDLFMRVKLFPLLERLGYHIIDPWALTPLNTIMDVKNMSYGLDKKIAWQKLNPIMGKNNKEGIDRASGVLAILDGTDVDSGTASEIGYAAALGKPILGYRGDFRLSADNEGSLVNLQVEYFIKLNGGTCVTTLYDIEEMLPKIFPISR